MNLTRCAGAVLIMATLFAGEAAGRNFPTFCIILRNEVAVPAQVLGAAQAQMDRIYRNAGFEIVWGDDDGSRRGCIVLKVEADAKGAISSAGVMGMALRLGRTRTASIFFWRVAEFAKKHHVTLPTLLGHVMAHEIGHLLLPANSHSSEGLMHGNWGIAHVQDARSGKLAFTEMETRLITRRLAEYESFFQLAHQP
jgi:hypothetical protein